MATRALRHRVALARPVIYRRGAGPRALGTDATIPVPGTGTILIDADTLTVGAQTVLRPRDRFAGAGALELADVKNASPASNLYGVVVVGNDANLGATVTPKAASVWDVSDRPARTLGIVASIAATVATSSTQLPAALVGGRLDVNIGASGVTVPVSIAAALDISDRVGRLLGHVTVDNASIAVTGTFWQATQPVSGTFWQATQPVSLAAAVDVSDRAGRLVGVVTLGAGTAQIGLAKISDGTDTALVTTAGRLNVQGSYDGLAQVMFTAEAVAGIIAETAVTLTLSRAFAATSTGTSFGPTAGKNLRIWGMYVTWVSTTTTANTVRLRIRVNAGGAATTASPLQFSARIGWESATFIANEAEMQPIMFPNPIEIPSGGQFMLTQACVAANGTTDVTLLCDEYTP